MRSWKIAAMTAGLLAAGCSRESTTLEDPNLGQSVRHNLAAQILPVPPSPAAGVPVGVPGRAADLAMERYLSGTVRKPYGSNGGAANGASPSPGAAPPPAPPQ